MYLISAYFDNKSTKALKRHIDSIAEVTGNCFMTDNNVPPHMTITSIEARRGELLVPAFEFVASQLQQGKIIIPTIGQLLPYVLYAGVVPNTYLNDVQRAFLEEIGKLPEVSFSKYYMQDSWLPHITLGKTLSENQMRTAFDIMRKTFRPIEAEIVSVGLAKTNPHEDIKVISLY